MRNAVTWVLAAWLALHSPIAFAQARAWLPFFADEQDVRILLDRLNSDPDVAFIIPNGPLESEEDRARAIRRLLGQSGQTGGVVLGHLVTDHRQQWRAVKTVDALADGEHALWYRPAGPLPLIKADRASDQPIPDPFAGWTEEAPSGQAPYFGSSSPAVIRLTLWTRHRPYTPEERRTLREKFSYWMGDHDYLVASDFQHVPVQLPASQGWLVRLERWMSTVSVRLENADYPEAWWAFPSALRKLKAGTPYYANGFNLDRSIRGAQVPVRP